MLLADVDQVGVEEHLDWNTGLCRRFDSTNCGTVMESAPVPMIQTANSLERYCSHLKEKKKFKSWIN